MTSTVHERDRVLVLGGTGFVGQSLCERLVQRAAGSGRVRVPTRRLVRARDLLPLPTMELVQADVHDDAALAALLPGCAAVVNLVAILHGRAADFERVHVALPRRLAAACRASGVHRVLHDSALGVGPDAPSHYLRSKAAGEAALQDAGLDLTILRPSLMYGAGDRLLNTFADLQAWLPLIPLAGATARFQPVWVEDVSAALIAALARPDSIGRVIEATGPDTLTLAEIVRRAGLWAGHARPVLSLPAPIARLQAALMALVPGDPLLSADNLRSLQVPSVASGALPGLASLDIEPASIDAIGPGLLGARATGRARFGAYRARRS
ncbi:MAG: complex I NDUFA9 subunit family protein [Rubrivivax sp.]